MTVSRKGRLPLRRCALVVLSLGLFFPAGSAAPSTPSGGVVAWGCPVFADVGECTVPAEASSGVTAIAASDAQSLALKTDGSVLAWGCGQNGGYGQCAVPAEASSGVTAIAAGYAHSLALKQDGSVIAWGCVGFDYGECTVPPGATSGVTAIAAGFSDSLALKQDGSVIAWGCGFPQDSGQCDVPVAALSGVTAIATAYGHSLALEQDGSVIAWGCIGFDFGCNVPAATQSGVTAIAAGTAHSLALKQDGSVIAWGCGSPYDLGQCTVPAAAQSGVDAITAGNYSSFALKDGHIIAWGCGSFADYGQCAVPPSAAGGVIAVAGGDFHTLAVVGPNQSPDCASVTATPSTLVQMRDKMGLITLSGATDPDGDTLSYHIDGVSQDEYVTGVGDDTFPDAALTAAGADSNRVLVRSEANQQFNGRVYRIAYTVSDGQGASCSGTAGPSGTTTATVGVPRKKGGSAIDDGDASSWNSFTGVRIS